MTRLLVLVVVAAAIVPTAVLGGSARSAAFGFRFNSTKHVVRVFRAQGIELRIDHSSSYGQPYTDLVGHIAGTTLDVQVAHPQPGSAAGGQIILFSESLGATGHPHVERLGFAYAGNVLVSWVTRGSCREDVSRVRTVLAGLREPNAVPLSVTCTKASVPYP